MNIAHHITKFSLTWRHLLGLALLVSFLSAMFPAQAYASVIDGTGIPDGTCTTEAKYFKIEEPASGEGIISSIIKSVEDPLKKVGMETFNAIAQDPSFKNSIRVLCSIYIAIYGIFFTFGMVQVTVHDFMVRLMKIAVMYMLLSADAWYWFDTIVVHFFNDSVKQIINMVSTIAFDADGVAGKMTGEPFDPLDKTLVYVSSSRMAVTLLATFTTFPYGPVIGLILFMSLGRFLKALFDALYVYTMALVIRTMMFGLAPIFIACIMFSRTRHLFDGWLNQIVNATLQPIFLFTFFSFFVLLIKGCIEQVLQTPVCWMPTQINSGTPTVSHFWRFAVLECGAGGNNAVVSNGVTYLPYDGLWSFDGAQSPDIPACNKSVIHPIGIITPLMLWVLADLAGRFNHIVIEIAKDLANAATDLTMGSKGVKEWFGKASEIFGNESSGATGVRKAPGSLNDIGNMLRSDNKPQGGAGQAVGPAAGNRLPVAGPPPAPK